MLLSAVLMGGNVQAEDNPFQFYTGDSGSYAKLNLEADLAVFAQSNSHFGNNIYESDSWWESLIRPGLDVNFVMPSGQSIYGQFDVVQAKNFGGNDAAGSNVGYTESALRIDHAYVGWKSGNLFSFPW